MKKYVVVLVALVGVVMPASAGDQFVLLSGGNRPTTAQFVEDGWTVTLIPRSGEAMRPFAMKLDDGLASQFGMIQSIRIDPAEVQFLAGLVEGAPCTGVSLDGRVISQGGNEFSLRIVGLTKGRHTIEIKTTSGNTEIVLEVVEDMIDLGTVPGSIDAIGVARAQPTPPTSQTPLTSPTSPQVTLSPEAARVVGDAARARGIVIADWGRVQAYSTGLAPGWPTALFLVIVDQYGRLVTEEVKLTRPDGEWATFGMWVEGGGLHQIRPFPITSHGVRPDERLDISLRGVVVATVTMPPAGQGLWLPIVVQR